MRNSMFLENEKEKNDPEKIIPNWDTREWKIDEIKLTDQLKLNIFSSGHILTTK